MTSFLDPLISFVSAHAWLAYLTLFLAALLEAVPVVGSVIPGSTIILALSALVPGGELKLPWVLLAASVGGLKTEPAKAPKPPVASPAAKVDHAPKGDGLPG